MDALEFLKERKRVCYLYDECDKCPFDSKCLGIINKSDEELKKIVDITEQWSKEHPCKTRQSVFLKQYPDAIISYDGLPEVAPCQLCVGLVHGKSAEDCEERGLCAKCRREFWMREVE